MEDTERVQTTFKLVMATMETSYLKDFYEKALTEDVPGIYIQPAKVFIEKEPALDMLKQEIENRKGEEIR
jgi:hypothetical protein